MRDHLQAEAQRRSSLDARRLVALVVIVTAIVLGLLLPGRSAPALLPTQLPATTAPMNPMAWSAAPTLQTTQPEPPRPEEPPNPNWQAERERRVPQTEPDRPPSTQPAAIEAQPDEHEHLHQHDQDADPATQEPVAATTPVGLASPPDPLSGVIGPIFEAEEPAPPISAVLATAPLPPMPAAYTTDGSPLIYLTFDDGPHEVWTPHVLDTLAAYGAVATFFVTGAHTTELPELVARAASAGHGIQNHTFYHPRLDQIEAETFRVEIERTDRAIQAALGVGAAHTTCLRPPFGAFNDETRNRAWALGKWLITWDFSPQDWVEQDPVKLATSTLERARPGAILLFHDTNRGMAEALPLILDQLSQRGYRFAVLCE